MFLWYFMRISGLVLVFLAVGHLFIMHIVNNVESINYAFVASRWTAPRTGWIWRGPSKICTAAPASGRPAGSATRPAIASPGRRTTSIDDRAAGSAGAVPWIRPTWSPAVAASYRPPRP